MPPAGERSRQPLVHNPQRFFFLENARAQRQHIGVVVLAAHLRLMLAAHIGGTDASNLVGSHGHANSPPAHQDAYIGALLAHIVRYQTGVVRIIDGLARPRAFVQELEPSLLKVLSYLVLEFVTSVICAQCYLHTVILRKPENRSQQKYKKAGPWAGLNQCVLRPRIVSQSNDRVICVLDARQLLCLPELAV